MPREPAAFLCKLCGQESGIIHYAGPIRMGEFGNVSTQEFRVVRCASCDCGFLDPAPAVDYDSEEYRIRVDGDASVARYYQLHDREQPQRLEHIPWHALRGAVVADIGCGAGSFLDLIRSVAAKTLAIEPTLAYREALIAKAHTVFPYCSDVTTEWQGAVDWAVSFSVIEHVADPVSFLLDIQHLLKPGGKLVLSTPNSDDWLLELVPEYRKFFYRAVHPWYFSAGSLNWLAQRAGYSSCTVSYAHRFDLSNVLMWLRDRQPSGKSKLAIGSDVNSSFRTWLESEGRSDYLYATLQK